jgi:hypothetical protein
MITNKHYHARVDEVIAICIYRSINTPELTQIKRAHFLIFLSEVLFCLNRRSLSLFYMIICQLCYMSYAGIARAHLYGKLKGYINYRGNTFSSQWIFIALQVCVAIEIIAMTSITQLFLKGLHLWITTNSSTDDQHSYGLTDRKLEKRTNMRFY